MQQPHLYKSDLLDENYTTGKIDFLLLAGGSDARAYEVLRKLESNSVEIEKILLFNFAERIQSIKSTDKYYEYEKSKYNSAIDFIDCNIKDPLSSFSMLQNKLSPVSANQKIAVDISCFTKPFFFYLLKYLYERLPISDPIIFYTEPFSYRFPQKGLFNSYHETDGPIKIAEIPGYSGIKERNSETVLVVQLGFEVAALEEIILDVSPNESFLINGFPSYTPKFKDISLLVNENYTSNKDSVILYSRANNPFETFNLLDKIKRNFNSAFINIAPLGTKPMALGACLFAIHNPDVKVLFPISEKYEKVTTDQSWHTWQYSIPLKFDSHGTV
jgi:hypothetical protein